MTTQIVDHTANPGIPFVPCLTPACGATPLRISPSLARAQIEYSLRDNPASQFKFVCGDCGRESRYTLDAIVAMIPSEQRPKPLRADEAIVLLLVELNTDDAMADHAFLGERTLVRRRRQVGAAPGLGEILVRPAMAQSLSPGEVVRFGKWGEFDVATSVVRHGDEVPLDVNLGAKSNAIGCFFASKAGQSGLRAGNLFCSNPSCCVVFGVTYSEFLSTIHHVETRAPQLGAQSAQVLLTCGVCGTSRVVDERSFEGVVKI